MSFLDLGKKQACLFKGDGEMPAKTGGGAVERAHDGSPICINGWVQRRFWPCPLILQMREAGRGAH